MRLYLKAKSKNKIGYTPDWLRIIFVENRHKMELTLEIMGSIGYQEREFDCCCKGELRPWALFDRETGEEIDYDNFTDEELAVAMPRKKVGTILLNAESFEVGVWPIDERQETLDAASLDVFSEGHGKVLFFDGENEIEKEFEFSADYENAFLYTKDDSDELLQE